VLAGGVLSPADIAERLPSKTGFPIEETRLALPMCLQRCARQGVAPETEMRRYGRPIKIVPKAIRSSNFFS